MLGDTLYLSTPLNRVVALDANTGRRIWTYDPEVDRLPMPGERKWVHRGVAVWTGDGHRTVLMNARSRLIALDAATGRPRTGFGAGGQVDLSKGLRWPVDPLQLTNTSPPVIVGDLVIVGSSVSDRIVHDRDPPGDVQAFDVRNGHLVWSWSPVPGPGEFGRDTWADSSADHTGHANVWAPFTADTARGLVYLPVSTPGNDWYGGGRLGDDLFAESLVCLDARTGRRRWHAQLIHHGLWDYDLAAPPTLVRIAVGGDSVDAVIEATKTGFLYAFDRVTGRPLWPIEERPVPPSTVPGERASATQPFPAGPVPFARQGFSLEDVAAFTPEIHQLAVQRIRGLRMGEMFTPPSLEGTIVMPGWIGGAGWGGGAFDPVTGVYFVKATNRPTLARLVPGNAADSTSPARYLLDPSLWEQQGITVQVPVLGGWLGRLLPKRPLPVSRPPYGTLTAIDLSTGATRWQVTLGDTPWIRRHPRLRGLDLPPLGVAGPPGAIATGAGLLFITGGGQVLYAIHHATGGVLWQYDLGQGASANPMTYRTALGRQFVLIANGFGAAARLSAFALPEGTR